MVIKIGNKKISKNDPCIISFEAGATFGTFAGAKELIKAAADAGADAIKFQTLLPGYADRLMGKKDIKIDYTTKDGKKQELVYDALKRRELSIEEWKELVKYSKDNGLVFITTPEFIDSVDFLEDIGVDVIKVSKGDIDNVLLIEKIAKSGLPIILDGREKFSDVEIGIKICEENNNNNIIIMHCPSGYPSENAGVHLNAIKTIQTKYDYPVGFADHSTGDKMNYAAIALGVLMLEKTITHDKTTDQVEHLMSLEPNELKSFVDNVRAVEQGMGDPDILFITRVEENARRSITTNKDVKKGEILTKEHLDFRRPGNMGISCSEGFNVLNKKAIVDISANSFLQWDMLE
jgi:N,N'-diacetyllegionaminate synthase